MRMIDHEDEVLYLVEACECTREEAEEFLQVSVGFMNEAEPGGTRENENAQEVLHDAPERLVKYTASRSSLPQDLVERLAYAEMEYFASV